MKIVSSDDDGTGHFCGNDLAGQNATPDRDITSEWAFLVFSENGIP
jgi:hypothetical protein